MINNFSISFTSLKFPCSNDSLDLLFYFTGFFFPAIFLTFFSCLAFGDLYACNSPAVSSCPSDWNGLISFQGSWPVFVCFDFLFNYSSLWWAWNFSSSTAASSDRNHNFPAFFFFFKALRWTTSFRLKMMIGFFLPCHLHCNSDSYGQSFKRKSERLWLKHLMHKSEH